MQVTLGTYSGHSKYTVLRDRMFKNPKKRKLKRTRKCFVCVRIHGMQWRQWIWTYLWSDITTPSCVYGRLFTCTRMVDCNALIVWKTVYRHLLSIKSSLWALTDAYTKFRRMIWSIIWSCGHRSRPPMCTVTSSKCPETSLGKSWKHTTLWFPGGSSHYRCWSAILVTIAMTQPPCLLTPSSLDFCPSPF